MYARNQYHDSETRKHHTSCSLFNEQHRISDDIASVLDELEQHDVETAAVGCGGCFVADTSEAVFYVAQQHRDVDSIYLKFDATDESEYTRRELGELVVETARELDVPVDWDGDESTAIQVGVDAIDDDVRRTATFEFKTFNESDGSTFVSTNIDGVDETAPYWVRDQLEATHASVVDELEPETPHEVVVELDEHVVGEIRNAENVVVYERGQEC